LLDPKRQNQGAPAAARPRRRLWRRLGSALRAQMAGRVSAASSAARRLAVSRRTTAPGALASLLLVGDAAGARAVACAESALSPLWARAASAPRGRGFCAAASGDGTSTLPLCSRCGTTLSAAWAQGLLGAAVRARSTRQLARRCAG